MKLKISDFQSIEKAELEIKGFSTLWGKNQVGKSAICRAISSALFGNSPKNFIRKGAKYSEVELSDKDFSLVWRKGEKVNQIEINGQLYDKIGKDIPKPVADLGFREVEIDNKILNPQYAEQFNPLFILNDSGSASTLATILTEISRLGRINTAITLVSRDEKRESSSLGMKTQALELATSNLKQMEEGFSALGDVDQILSRSKSVLQKADEIAALEQTKNSLQDINKQLRFYTKALKMKVPNLQPMEKKVQDLNILASLSEELAVVNSVARKKFKKFTPLSDATVREFVSFSKLAQEFGSVQMDLNEGQSKLQELKKNLEAVAQKKLLLQKEYPTCPICEKPW